jgi:hypothetical protein
MILKDLIEKGYTYTFDNNLLPYIQGYLSNIDNWTRHSSGIEYPEDQDLNPAMDYIQNKYVQPIFGKNKKGYKALWNKSESSSMQWHNDLKEGPNLFFLYYLNDIQNGGEIKFRVYGIETGYLQAKRGLLVMGSQESHVEHKVEPTEETRIVANFGFYVSSELVRGY